MKRPFALFGFTLFAFELGLFLSGRADIAFFGLAFFLLIFLISLFSKKLRQDMRLPLLLFAAVLSCLLFLLFSGDKTDVQSLTGDNVPVTAKVSEAPYRNGTRPRYYVVCDLEGVSGKQVKGKLRLSFSPEKDGISPESLQIGNEISFSAKLYVPGQNEKSIERYFTSENILLGAYGAKDFTVSEPEIRGLSYYFHKMRSFVTGKLAYSFSDDTAGVLVGILTGDKSCLQGDIYKAFRESGIAHLMAVSGLHLSVWVFFLGGLIGEDDRFYKLKYLLLLFVTVFIMFFAGMSESVVRAGFMSVVHLLGKLAKRRSDSINNLGIAMLIMIAANPACVMSVSLQLSFFSTLSILTLGKLYMKKSCEIFGGERINTKLRKTARLCLDSFCISISVLIFTFPVLVYSFGGISTVSAFVNLLLVPVTTPLLVLAGSFVLVSAIPFIAYPVGIVVELIASYVIGVSKLFSSFRNAFIIFEAENILLYLAGFILVGLFTLLLLKRDLRLRRLTIASCLILTLTLIVVYERSAEGLRISVGKIEEESVVFIEKDKKAVLLTELPYYEREILESMLEERGADLSAVLKSEAGLSLINSGDGKRLFTGTSQGEVLESVTVTKLDKGTELSFGENKIGIFAKEDLQRDDNYDIIIGKENEGTDKLLFKKEEKEFYVRDGEFLTVTIKNNSEFFVRGEFSWQNLMKSS